MGGRFKELRLDAKATKTAGSKRDRSGLAKVSKQFKKRSNQLTPETPDRRTEGTRKWRISKPSYGDQALMRHFEPLVSF